MTATLSFDEICELEPRVGELLREVQAVKDTGGESFCANDHWCLPGGFESRLCRLVGWRAAKPELRNSECYDIAYDHLYVLLPSCRECRCITFERAMGLRPPRTGGRS
jgi:hypothetical protein